MSSFKVGDRVVCVNATGKISNTLIEGREYIIYAINKCCREVIDVGLFNRFKVVCPSCKQIHSERGGIDWNKSDRFRKVEEKKEVQYVKQETKVEEPCLN